MTGDENILLGTIAKTHGVRGELILRTANPSYDLKENWESIFLKIDGILVPFFISTLRPFKTRELVLKLDWHDDKNKAESLAGYEVWIPDNLLEPVENEVFLDELIGYKFRDSATGKEGTISDFIDIPDNPVFEVEINGEKKLVPASEELILEIDADKGEITFELPEGLL